MKICFLTARPDHPLLAATEKLLAPTHEVTHQPPPPTLSPPTLSPSSPLADVYLLKSRTPEALALARAYEERGARVLNSAAATELCQDRTAMAALALQAGLPFARTHTPGTLTHLTSLPALPFPHPLVVKSRHSRRDDLVARADTPAQLRALAADWPDEPVVIQQFTPNSGWDHKLWVIADQVFAANRRSELSDTPTTPPPPPLTPTDLPPSWLTLVRTVGKVFALDVYGVDVITTPTGTPLIVDINAFPGIRNQPGAPEALATLALRAAEG
ncbi:ATP-grasp domain-containing protein [Streptomyces liangshanensis]|uniref:Alpha-L-glutamate ligase n=1 Tax=Streptomyces liangshanensis TaxID=2717324 RepID=A0A6G9H0K8_9ACTN|nr:alpha-L-glutamate ligase [Streptomyces liangshanensis]QIQ04000.1 alpha-L-glutamate ligase [Streptomyces liangshanensis]